MIGAINVNVYDSDPRFNYWQLYREELTSESRQVS